VRCSEPVAVIEPATSAVHGSSAGPVGTADGAGGTHRPGSFGEQ
jgi:hypothetical protein